MWLYYHHRSSHTCRRYWYVRTCVCPSVRDLPMDGLKYRLMDAMEFSISVMPVYDRTYSWLSCECYATILQAIFVTFMWMLRNCTTGNIRDFYVNVMPVYYRPHSWFLMWMLCHCTTAHIRDFLCECYAPVRQAIFVTLHLSRTVMSM